jgi:hypothetical protein
MNPHIKDWVARLQGRGYQNVIVTEHWDRTEEGLAARKWFEVSAEGTLLEVVQGSVYLRINAHSRPPEQARPFHVLMYQSTEHPHRPKTEFFSKKHDRNFEFVAHEHVSEKLAALS